MVKSSIGKWNYLVENERYNGLDVAAGQDRLLVRAAVADQPHEDVPISL